MTGALRPGRRARHAIGLACLVTAVVLALAVVRTFQAPRDLAPAAAPAAAVRELERTIRETETLVARMERSAARFEGWLACISEVPVDEGGDPDQQFGYVYDEKDGTGQEYRRVLAVAPHARRPDFLFLDFSRRTGCLSVPTRPGTPENPGTADNAAFELTAPSARPSSADRVRRLQAKLAELTVRAARLERMSERFDEWESCLSWVPVTEYGDPDGRYGYAFTDADGGRGYRPALAVDISEWDDPDFMLLAFAGPDRPFSSRECDDEPGESVD